MTAPLGISREAMERAVELAQDLFEVAKPALDDVCGAMCCDPEQGGCLLDRYRRWKDSLAAPTGDTR